MSGDMFSNMTYVNNDEKVQVTYGRVDMASILKKICKYRGNCKKHRTNTNYDLCLLCKHRSSLDIPKIIDDELSKIKKQ